MAKAEASLNAATVSLLMKRNEWTMIKEIIEELELDADMIHLPGYVDALVDTGILQFKQVSSAKHYRLRSS